MTPLKIRRVLAAVATSALVGAGLVACGSDDEGSGDAGGDTSQSSDDQSEGEDEGSDGPPFDVAEGEEVDAAEFADYYETAATAEESAAVEQVVTTGGQTVEYSGVTTFTPGDIQVSLEGDTDVIIVDDVVYTQLEPGDDQFVSIDLSDPNNPFAQAFAVTAKPDVAAAALGEAAQSVTYVGTTEVNGDDADTYELVIDTAAFYEAVGLSDFASLVEQGQVPAQLDQTVAFDSEGRIVQTVQTVEATGATPETTTEITYSDFGVEVDVEAPADAIPFEEALGGLGA